LVTEELRTFAFEVSNATLVTLRLPVVAKRVRHEPPAVHWVYLRSTPNATPLLPSVFREWVFTCKAISHCATPTTMLEAYEPK